MNGNPNVRGLHGDVLVHSRPNELRFYDARTLTAAGTLDLPHDGFCYLPNGTLAALVQARDAKRCEIHLIDEARKVHVLWGPEFNRSYASEVVPGQSSFEVFVYRRP